MNTTRRQYYAISYHEPKIANNTSGDPITVPCWKIIVGPCSSREEAQEKGAENIDKNYPPDVTGRMTVTGFRLHNHMIVVSKWMLSKYRILLEEENKKMLPPEEIENIVKWIDNFLDMDSAESFSPSHYYEVAEKAYNIFKKILPQEVDKIIAEKEQQ